jgi:5'-3' exonuclease
MNEEQLKEIALLAKELGFKTNTFSTKRVLADILEEEKHEDKKDEKHESFEALAKGHAMKVKEEMKKEASFDTAVALRAAEMILNGEV